MSATATAIDTRAPQYMKALQKANEIRLGRAEMKRKVARGELNAGDIILTCPNVAKTMSISDLLTSQRRWGHNRMRKFLAAIPMAETKTIGSMTERQRRALAANLALVTSAEASIEAPPTIEEARQAHLEHEAQQAEARRTAQAQEKQREEARRRKAAEEARRIEVAKPRERVAPRPRTYRDPRETPDHTGVPIGPSRRRRQQVAA